MTAPLLRCTATAAVLLVAAHSPARAQDAPARAALLHDWAREVRGDVLTPAAWAGSGAGDVYRLLHTAKPEWLRPRRVGLGATQEVAVYHDRLRLGGPDALRRIHPHLVTSIRYVAATEAAATYGPGHEAGVLVVSSR